MATPNPLLQLYGSQQVVGLFGNSNTTGARVDIFDRGASNTGYQLLVQNSNFSILSGSGQASNVRMGIGSTAPAATLDIVGSSATLPVVRITQSNTTGTSLNIVSGTANVVTVIGSNVGINTATPSEALDVTGFVKSTQGLKLNSRTVLDTNANFAATSATITSSNITVGPALAVNHAGTGDIAQFSSSNNPLVTLSSTGYIGIGTTSPQYNLDTVGYVRSTLGFRVGDQEVIDADGNIIARNIEVLDGTGATALYVANDGSVGIGTDVPLAKTHILHTGTGDAFRVDDAAGDTTPFIVTETGNVGIGTTNPSSKLVVSGDITTNSLYINSPLSSNTSLQSIYQVAYPPSPLTSDTTILTNQLYGNGTYTVTYSSGSLGWNAFDRSATSLWSSLVNKYNNTTGAYTGAITQADTYAGEFIDIALPDTINLAQITLQNRTNTDRGSARTWRVYGTSNNGTTWAILLDIVNDTGFSGSGSIKTFNCTTIGSYNRFRLVFNAVNIAGTASAINIAEILLQGTPPNPHLLITDTRFLVMNSRMGIGTTSPTTNLEVTGVAKASKLVLGTATDASTTRLIEANDSNQATTTTRSITLGKLATAKNQTELGYTHIADDSNANYGQLGLNTAPAIFFTGDSNVGIGTTNPLKPFMVQGETQLNIMTGTATEGKLVIGRTDNPPFRYHEIAARNSDSSTLNYIGFNLHVGGASFNSNVTRVLTLQGNGNVGIGTSNPGYVLDVATSTTQDIYEFPSAALSAYTDTVSGAFYGNGIHVVTSSSVLNSTYEAFEAFNKTQTAGTDGWISTSNNYVAGAYIGSSVTGTYQGEYIQLQLPRSIVLKKFSITSRNSTSRGDPKDFAMFGSINGSTWVQLFMTTAQSFGSFTTNTYTVTNSTAYVYYRLAVNGTTEVGGTIPWVSINELRLFGTHTDTLSTLRVQPDVLYTPYASIGIGTATPAQKLHVIGNAIITGTVDTETQFYGRDADSASMPSFSWTSNNKSGMFSPASNQIAFSTDSTERLRILSDGKVGIGTTNPVYSLNLYENANPMMVVGYDRQNQIFPPILLTSNVTVVSNAPRKIWNGTYTVTASAEVAAQPAYYAFDQSNMTTFWQLEATNTQYSNVSPFNTASNKFTIDTAGTSNYGDWIQIQFPYNIIPTSINIQNAAYTGSPDLATVLASTDNTTWARLGTISLNTSNNIRTITVTSNQNPYNYYRTVVSSIAANAPLRMYEIRVNGYIEQDYRFGLGTATPTATMHVEGDILSTGALIVGNNGNSNIGGTIYFGGTFGDNFFDHTVIEGRRYNSASTESSELLLFKGNDPTGPAGPDRIRLRATQIVFDTYSNVGGTDRTAENIQMVITEGGNVGIGTTNPSVPLHIVGSIAVQDSNGIDLGFGYVGREVNAGKIAYARFSSNLDIVGAGTTSSNRNIQLYDNVSIGSSNPLARLHIENQTTSASFRVDDGPSDTTPFIIDADGNVGIGTFAPSNILHVNSATDPTIRVGNGTVGGRLQLGNQSHGLSRGSNATINSNIVDANDVTMHTLGSGSLLFSTNPISGGGAVPLERMRIMANGNVGIGKTNAATILDVNGTVTATALTAPNITATTQFLGNASDTASAPSFTWTGNTNTGIYRGTTNTIDFSTAGSNRMTIDANGDVGINIGACNVTSKLQVFSTIGAAGSNPIYGQAFFYNPSNATNQHASCLVQTAGPAGGNPYYGLDVSSVGGWSMGVMNTDGTNDFTIRAAWNYTLSTSSALEVFRMERATGNLSLGTSNTTFPLYTYRNSNFGAQVVMENASTGTGAWAGFTALNSGFARSGMRIGVLSTTWATPNQAYLANGGFVGTECNLAGGLTIIAEHVNANMRFYTGGVSNINERMRIDSNGNVGISTTNPLADLHVYGKMFVGFDNILGGPANGVTGGIGTKLILWEGSGSATPFALGISNATLWYGVPTNGRHEWFEGTTSRMILSNGNVGIGISNPTTKLDVNGTVTATAVTATNITATTQFLGNATDTAAAPAFTWTGDTNTGMYRGGTADTINFSTAGSHRMTINADGDVGIGTAAPASVLHVWGSNGGPSNALLVTGNSNPTISLGITSWNTTSNAHLGYATIAHAFASNVVFGDLVIKNMNVANSIHLVAGGNTPALSVGVSNVGIGVTNPVIKLHVDGSILASNATNPTIFVGTGSPNFLRMGYATGVNSYAVGAANGDGVLRVDNSNAKLHLLTGSSNAVMTVTSNLVGIGITNPVAKLHVTVPGGNTATYTDCTRLQCETHTLNLYWRNSNIGLDVGSTTNSAASAKRSIILNEYADATCGFVGIGTPTPTTKLDVNGTINATNLTLTNPLIVSEGGTGAATFTANKVLVGNATGAFISAANLHWDNTNSRLGIGTASPLNALHIEGATNVLSFGTTLRQMINLFSTTYGIGIQGFTLYNRTESHFAWYRGGTYSNAAQNPGTGGVTGMMLDSNLALKVAGDITAFSTFSDLRMKENIHEIPSTLDSIRTLRAVDFRWKNDIYHEPRRGTEDVGFIAQEVEPLFPKLVKNITSPGGTEDYKGVAYEKFAPYLVKAIQELDEENKILRSEINILKEQVAELIRRTK